MTSKIRFPRIREADLDDEEELNVEMEEEEAENDEDVEIEQIGDETVSFDALLSMMETVRNDPSMLEMTGEDKKQMWPMVKRTLQKYSERLGDVDTQAFRNFFRP